MDSSQHLASGGRFHDVLGFLRLSTNFKYKFHSTRESIPNWRSSLQARESMGQPTRAQVSQNQWVNPPALKSPSKEINGSAHQRSSLPAINGSIHHRSSLQAINGSTHQRPSLLARKSLGQPASAQVSTQPMGQPTSAQVSRQRNQWVKPPAFKSPNKGINGSDHQGFRLQAYFFIH